MSELQQEQKTESPVTEGIEVQCRCGNTYRIDPFHPCLPHGPFLCPSCDPLVPVVGEPQSWPIAMAAQTPQGMYKHYKGATYLVLFVGRLSTNGAHEGSPVVIYVSLLKGTVNVRDEGEFHEWVTDDKGELVRRFTYVGRGA